MEPIFSEVMRVFRKDDIARRYFIMNSFDGALTILGIIVALYLSGTTSVKVIIVSCVGAAIAMGVSGLWGAYSAEYAERLRKFKELERHMMKKLNGTDLERRMKIITVTLALVDGLSPAAISLIILLPFLMLGYFSYGVMDAYHMSIGIVDLILLGLGVIVGAIAKESVAYSAAKMLLAGIIVAAISVTLDSMKVI